MDRVKSSFLYIFHKATQKWTILGILGIITILLWIAVFANPYTDKLQVYFFDVGQGDAAFIQFPDRRQILIDGGRNSKVLEKLADAMPFWDRSIDVMIATHGDADHIAGLVPVLKHYKISTIIWNGIEADSTLFEEWKDAVEKEDAQVMIGSLGTRITFSDYAFMEIIHPSQQNKGLESADQNELSIVARLVYGNDSFLFTGDVERQTEYSIYSKRLYVESDILKIAHHGSKTSTSQLFIEKVHPQIAVISSGRKNSYGHPHASVLDTLARYNIEVQRTDKQGDILLLSDGDSF
jgi:competence protein ComEC